MSLPSTPHSDNPVVLAGASEIVLAASNRVFWPNASGGHGQSIVPNTPERAAALRESVIESMAKQSLRTIGLAYRDFPSRAELPRSWQQAPSEWTEGEATVEQVTLAPRCCCQRLTPSLGTCACGNVCVDVCT